MFLTDKLGIVLLGIGFIVQSLVPPEIFRRATKALWILGTIIIGGVLLYWVLALYSAWEGNGITKFFLPPYQPPGYFLLYARKLFAPWVLSWGTGIVLAWGTRWLNRYYEDRFLEEGESALLGLCFFLCGYPTFLWYGVAMLAVGVCLTGVYGFFRWGRAPLYYWWVPMAMFVIILEVYLVPESIRSLFTF